MLQSFLTIDPGSNIGGALFMNSAPLFTFVIKDKKDKDNQIKWHDRLPIIIKEFKKELIAPKQFTDLVYIERPMFMGDDVRGIITAKSDSLYKLTTIYGAILDVLHDFRFKIEYLKPWQWKGQLNKKQLAYRLKLLTNNVYPDHIADAIGMGYYILGKFPNVRSAKR